MTALQTRLQDPEYVNFLKAGLCLKSLKTGLEPFAKEKSKELLQEVENFLAAANIPVTGNPVCPNVSITKNNSCCHLFCNKFLRAIIRVGIDQTHRITLTKENIGNSNPQLWHNTPWELAKVFMNHGQTSQQAGPAETDLSGIINFLDHCKICRKDIQNHQNLEEVRRERNKLMHSADLKLSNADYNKMVQTMIDLLEDPMVLRGLQDAQDAVTKIREVNVSRFFITLEDESLILNDLINEMQKLTKDVTAKLEGLKTELCEFERSANQDITQLSKSIQSEIEKRKKTISKVKTTLKSLKTKIENDEILKVELMDKVTEIQGSVDTTQIEIRRRFEDIEKTIEIQKHETNILKKKTDALDSDVRSFKRRYEQQSVTEEDCQKLQQFLLETYKTICDEVSMSPIYEGPNDDVLKAPISEIYTDVTIVHQNSGGKTSETELKSYKDLFFYNGRSNRNIFVKGEAGIGKSVWCRRILYSWCKTHGYFSERSFSDNENDIDEVMSDFDYVFFVPLRYVEGSQSKKETERTLPLKEALFSSTLERMAENIDVFEHILKKMPSKVLFLIDGFDEFEGSLSYSGINTATVITTTRPWKFELYRSKRSCTKFDAVLCLKGLNAQGIENMIDKTLSVFAEDAPDRCQQRNKCLNDIISAGLLENVKYPLMLLIVVLTWLKNCRSLSSSATKNVLSMLEVIFLKGEEKLSTFCSPVSSNSEIKDNETVWLSDFPTLKRYSILIKSLGKLAFVGLTSEEKSSSVVFSEHQAISFLSDKLEICFRFGVLTESSVFSSLLEKKKRCISFYHKVLQELFAAVWIVSNKDAFEHFNKIVNNIENALVFENVLIFMCGLDTYFGNVIFQNLASKCEEDNLIIGYRPSFLKKEEDDYFRSLETLSQMASSCLNEMNLRQQSAGDVRISDVRWYCCTENDIDALIRLMNCSSACMKTVYIHLTNELTNKTIGHLMQCFNTVSVEPAMRYLEMLYVEGSFTTTDNAPHVIQEASQKHVIRNHDQSVWSFAIYNFENLNQIKVTKVYCESFMVSELQNLSELTVHEVEAEKSFQIRCCPKLAKISVCDIRCREFKLINLPVLETVKLVHIDCLTVIVEENNRVDIVLNVNITCAILRLSGLQSICHLEMKECTITETIDVRNCGPLETILLENITYRDVTYLHLVNLTEIPLGDLCLSKLFSCFQNVNSKCLKIECVKCKTFDFGNGSSPATVTVNELYCTNLAFHDISNLTRLELSDVQTGNNISLCNCLQLEELKLENIKIRNIKLENLRSLKKLSACNIRANESISVRMFEITSVINVLLKMVECGTMSITVTSHKSHEFYGSTLPSSVELRFLTERHPQLMLGRGGYDEEAIVRGCGSSISMEHVKCETFTITRLTTATELMLHNIEVRENMILSGYKGLENWLRRETTPKSFFKYLTSEDILQRSISVDVAPSNLDIWENELEADARGDRIYGDRPFKALPAKISLGDIKCRLLTLFSKKVKNKGWNQQQVVNSLITFVVEILISLTKMFGGGRKRGLN